MKTIDEVASYVHNLASHRSGIAMQFKWAPHDTRACEPAEIRRRAAFVLSHVTDLSVTNDERFKLLQRWARENAVTP